MEIIKALASILLILGSALPFGYLGRPTEMGLGLLVGGIAAAFVNIDKIQRVKGAGFEAVMRKAVEEAYATTEALRQVASPFLQSTLHIMTLSGRLGQMNTRQVHSFRDELQRLASKLNIADDPGVRSATELFSRYHTWDQFTEFRNPLNHLVSEETLKRLGEMVNYDSSAYPSRLEIEAALGNEIDKLRVEDKERMEDYIYYREKGSLRRS
jgi:hypothetical protein